MFKKEKKKKTKNDNKTSVVLKVLHVIGYISTLFLVIMFIYACANPTTKAQNKEYNSITNKEIKDVSKAIFDENYITIGYEDINPKFLYEFVNVYINQFDITTTGVYNYELSTSLGSYNRISYHTGGGTNWYNSSMFRCNYTTFFSNPTNFRNSYLVQFDNSSTFSSTRYCPVINTTIYNGFYYYGVFTMASLNTTYTQFTNRSDNNLQLTSIRIGNPSQDMIDVIKNNVPNAQYNIAYQNGYDTAVNDIVNHETELDLDTIRFSEVFDWRILLTHGVNAQTGLFLTNTDSPQLVELKGMTFSSNGKTYNGIRLALVPWSYDNTYIGVRKIIDNQDQLVGYSLNSIMASPPSGMQYTCIASVVYCYYENDTLSYGDSVWVGYTENALVPRYANNAFTTYGHVMDFTSPYWINDNYKTLVVINKTSDGANSYYYPSTSLYDLLSANSNILIADYSTYADIFTLIGGAFSSMTNVFNMSVLPSITLGTLVFIPLLVIVFITIIRLIKR